MSAALTRAAWVAGFLLFACQALAQIKPIEPAPPMPPVPNLGIIAPTLTVPPMPPMPTAPTVAVPPMPIEPSMPMPDAPLAGAPTDPELGSSDQDLTEEYQKIVDLYEAGKYDDAEPLADDFLKQIKARFHEDTAPYAAAISVLARLYQAQGRFPQAEAYVKSALAIDKQNFPANHPNIAGDLFALGQLYQAQRRLEEAELPMKEALTISEATHPPDPLSVGRALNNLAWLYQEQARYAEAEPLVTRALKLIAKAKGLEDEDYGRALDTLAKLYEGQARFKEAEQHYRRALKILEARRGPDYAGVASSRENLGGLLKSLRRLDEAEPLLTKALATKERVFGSNHPLVANSLSQLGDLYRLQGRAKEAEALFQRALAIRKATVREVTVYFATDRKQIKDAKSITFSDDASNSTLTYGQATVIVDKPQTTPGRTLSNAPLPDTARGAAQNIETTVVAHFAKRSVVAADEHVVMDKAQKQLDSAHVFPKQVFVFVHGFNVSFENALCRTAQIAYDLNFDGAPFLFSWPGGNGLLSYWRVNSGSAKTASDHLIDFLEKIVAETHATKIHLIAHSMGNTVLLDALNTMKRTSGDHAPWRFAEIIMHSPDVSNDRFGQVMTAIKGLGSGATLYASSNDRALGLSGWISGAKAGGDAAIFAGVETIDVTAAGSSLLGFNHDTYATNAAIFNDMRVVLELGRHPPDKRSASFQPTITQGGTYWLYRRPDPGIASADALALPVLAPPSTATADAQGIESVQPVPAPSSSAITASPSPDAERSSPEPTPPTTAPPNADGTTASIANSPKATFKRKKRKPAFDPDWNTKPLQ